MRQDDDGRGTVFPWGDAPTAPAWTVGEPIYSGDSRGTVVSVDPGRATISVEWVGGAYGAITYPADATFLRKKMPWEN